MLNSATEKKGNNYYVPFLNTNVLFAKRFELIIHFKVGIGFFEC